MHSFGHRSSFRDLHSQRDCQTSRLWSFHPRLGQPSFGLPSWLLQQPPLVYEPNLIEVADVSKPTLVPFFREQTQILSHVHCQCRFCTSRCALSQSEICGPAKFAMVVRIGDCILLLIPGNVDERERLTHRRNVRFCLEPKTDFFQWAFPAAGPQRLLPLVLGDRLKEPRG